MISNFRWRVVMDQTKTTTCSRSRRFCLKVLWRHSRLVSYPDLPQPNGCNSYTVWSGCEINSRRLEGVSSPMLCVRLVEVTMKHKENYENNETARSLHKFIWLGMFSLYRYCDFFSRLNCWFVYVACQRQRCKFRTFCSIILGKGFC